VIDGIVSIETIWEFGQFTFRRDRRSAQAVPQPTPDRKRSDKFGYKPLAGPTV